MAEEVSFHEEQQFRQPWLWLIIVVSAAGVVGLPAWGIIQQLVYHIPFGSKPMSDGGLIVFSACVMLLGSGMLWLFLAAKLVTEVRGDGVYVRFFPFHRRFHWFHFRDMIAAHAVTYRPLRDYGGWGIRYGANGKAYNVSGDTGVLITFGNGRTLMIGSMHAEELAAAIEAGRQHPGD